MNNEALVEDEEQDIVSLLAMQSEEEDDGSDEDYEVSDELPEDPEELRALLLKEREIKKKRNKTLKIKGQTNHRMQEEIEALQKQVEEMRNTPNQTPDVEAKNREREEVHKKWRDSVADNPELAVDFTTAQMSELQNNMVDVLSSMKTNFEAQLAEIKGEMDPEKNKYRDKINMLKTNPKLAGVDEGSLLAMAQAMEGIKTPPAPIGGRRATLAPDPEKALKETKEAYLKMFESM